MKKMTLEQKKQRIKEIKVDLAKSAKKTHSFGQRIIDSLKQATSIKAKKTNCVLRERVPADDLPGTWVKLPPMQWPEWLPVKVPLSRIADNLFSLYDEPSQDADGCVFKYFSARETAYAICYAIRRSPSCADMQSAWSETLIRLGYTADWTDEDERRWEAKR